MGSALSSVVFQPPRPPSYSNDANIVWITTSKGNEIPCFHCFRSKESFTILFSHGNAEDLGMIVNYFKEASAAWDVNIFAYEYTGYGLARGVPSEANVYADIEAAYRYLTVESQIPESKIVLYGRSLGSGPSVHLARHSNVRGLILQSGLASVHRVGLKFIPFTLPGDMFCNIDKIRDVNCPVFFIHGIKDEIVPFHHSAELYNACSTPVTPYWLADAGHNNVEIVGRQEFTQNMIRFLKGLARSPALETASSVLDASPSLAKIGILMSRRDGTSSSRSCDSEPLLTRGRSEVERSESRFLSSSSQAQNNCDNELSQAGHATELKFGPRSIAPADVDGDGSPVNADYSWMKWLFGSRTSQRVWRIVYY